MLFVHNLRFSNSALNNLYLLEQTSAAIRRTVEENICDEDINLTQLRILLLLRYHSRPLTLAEICHCAFRESQTITVTINRLNEKGYVEKVEDNYDKRKTRIRITEKGEQVIKINSCWMMTLLNETVQCFSEDELRQFEGYLNKLHEWVFKLLGTHLVEPLNGFCGDTQLIETNLDGLDRV